MATCRTCEKDFKPKEEAIKFVTDNFIIYPTWICDECLGVEKK